MTYEQDLKARSMAGGKVLGSPQLSAKDLKILQMTLVLLRLCPEKFRQNYWTNSLIRIKISFTKKRPCNWSAFTGGRRLLPGQKIS